jgi:hypothetical protein
VMKMLDRPADGGAAASAKVFESMVSIQNRLTEATLQVLETKAQYEGGGEDPPWMKLADRVVGVGEKMMLDQQVKKNEEQLRLLAIGRAKVEQDRRLQAARVQQAPPTQVPQPQAPKPVAPPAPAQAGPPPQPQVSAAPPAPPPAPTKLVDALVQAARQKESPKLIAVAVCEALKGQKPHHKEFQRELDEDYQGNPDLMFTDKLTAAWLLAPENKEYAVTLAQTIEAAIQADPDLVIEDDDDEDDEPAAASGSTVNGTVVETTTAPPPIHIVQPAVQEKN